MGSLKRFDLAKYREAYSLDMLFETGTLFGDGVQRALDAGFQRVISVEIVDSLFEQSAERFREDPRVTIIHGESTKTLDELAGNIPGRVLFWLDAHFPGADGGLATYDECPNEDVRCPLLLELEAILQHRKSRKDVLIIDDLDLYEDGEFEEGNVESVSKLPENTSLEILDSRFADDHYIVKLYYDQGYVLVLPDDTPPKLYIKRSASYHPAAHAFFVKQQPTTN